MITTSKFVKLHGPKLHGPKEKTYSFQLNAALNFDTICTCRPQQTAYLVLAAYLPSYTYVSSAEASVAKNYTMQNFKRNIKQFPASATKLPKSY